MDNLTLGELKKCLEKRLPVLVQHSYFFSYKPTFLTMVEEHEGFGAIVQVEGSEDKYEGFRIIKYSGR